MSRTAQGTLSVLLVEDDEDASLMLRDALREAQLEPDVRFVADGV